MGESPQGQNELSQPGGGSQVNQAPCNVCGEPRGNANPCPHCGMD